MKTPNNKFTKKEKRSPIALKTPKDLSNYKTKKTEDDCTTPKANRTPKSKANISNIKQRIEILQRK